MQHFETAVTNDKAAITVPKKGTVKTMDAATDDMTDITSLFALGNTTGLSLRPSDKKVQDKEVEVVLKAGDALSVKNEMYHKEYVVRGNQALYELLSEIYALALKINMSASKANILEAMRDKLKDRNMKTQYKPYTKYLIDLFEYSRWEASAKSDEQITWVNKLCEANVNNSDSAVSWIQHYNPITKAKNPVDGVCVYLSQTQELHISINDPDNNVVDTWTLNVKPCSKSGANKPVFIATNVDLNSFNS